MQYNVWITLWEISDIFQPPDVNQWFTNSDLRRKSFKINKTFPQLRKKSRFTYASRSGSAKRFPNWGKELVGKCTFQNLYP
jgi:hypothetical protein